MAKSSSGGATAYYARYKLEKRWESNRLKKLERALKKNPGNAEQIKLAMKNIVYRRKTPNNKVWSSSTRRLVTLFKKFTGAAPIELTSSNDKVSAEALMRKQGNLFAVHQTYPPGQFGMLYRRAHTSEGLLVWS